MRSLLTKKNAGRTRSRKTDNRLERAALSERDDWRSACLRLDNRDSEILLGRENESARSLKVVAQDFERLIAKDLYVGPADGLDFSHIRAIADHDQPALRRLENAFTMRSIRLYGTMREAVR